MRHGTAGKAWLAASSAAMTALFFGFANERSILNLGVRGLTSTAQITEVFLLAGRAVLFVHKKKRFIYEGEKDFRGGPAEAPARASGTEAT
jgi:hypothetical protein